MAKIKPTRTPKPRTSRTQKPPVPTPETAPDARPVRPGWSEEAGPDGRERRRDQSSTRTADAAQLGRRVVLCLRAQHRRGGALTEKGQEEIVSLARQAARAALSQEAAS